MNMDKQDILNEAELTCKMKTASMGRVLYYYDETDSTNLEAKRLADTGAPHGTLVVAEAQTKGRGRRGREWESPAGSSIYFSLLVRPKISSDRTSMLTLVMALSVAGAVGKAGGEAGQEKRALIKWPNDIVMDGRKVCGILTELIMREKSMNGVVIGVGVNVNQQDSSEFPEQIRENAGSVYMACHQKLNRADLIADIMQTFEENYEIFLQTCDLTGLKEAYESRLANLDRQVRVMDPKGEYTGTARGINTFGELRVERDDGIMESVYAGEVSVRGLYGYI